MIQSVQAFGNDVEKLTLILIKLTHNECLPRLHGMARQWVRPKLLGIFGALPSPNDDLARLHITTTVSRYRAALRPQLWTGTEG